MVSPECKECAELKEEVSALQAEVSRLTILAGERVTSRPKCDHDSLSQKQWCPVCGVFGNG